MPAKSHGLAASNRPSVKQSGGNVALGVEDGEEKNK